MWIYFLIDKKEVSSILKMFFSMVGCHFKKQVKIIKIDNGTKFTCMKNYFLENGINLKNILYRDTIKKWMC